MKPERLTAIFFLIVIMIFMCLVPVSIVNKFVHKLTEPDSSVNININWEKRYPFDDDAGLIPHKNETSMIDYVKEKIESYTSNKLLIGQSVIEAGKMYEELIGWNIAAVEGYNPVIKLHDGYLSGLTVSRDVSDSSRAVKRLEDFCHEQGIEFIYINLPNKICIYEDSDISGTLDFANQNVDRLLRQLEDDGVRYYDFRRLLHKDGMSHHGAFFFTDHHWKPEAGLWAARHILQIFRDDYGWNIEPEILNPENFEHVVYRNWFLGSQGKKLTLARTKPDDFTVLYPKFNTRIRFEVPSRGIDTSGDLSVVYNMQLVDSKDYYALNPYGAYKYGDLPLSRIHNYLNFDGRKLLFIHDSTSNCVIPFVALEVEYTDEIDLRHFTGSLRSYIKSFMPDAVIVAYYSGVPGSGGEAASYEDKKMYDFR